MIIRIDLMVGKQSFLKKKSMLKKMVNSIQDLFFVKKEFVKYGQSVAEFDLAEEGKIKFAQWLHPNESPVHIDQSTVDFYKQFVKKGSLVIDIGTHTGDTTVPMAIAAGPQGLTLGLEPNPHLYPTIKMNAGLNKEKTNIIALNFAATTHDGEFTFASGDASFNNGGIMGFSTNIKKNNRYTFQVQGKNLQEYLFKEYPNWLDRLTLIKIDAEGYDKEILKTMPLLIQKYKPTIITECFKHLTSSERNDLFDTLSNHGYQLYFIDDFGNKNMPAITREGMNSRKHFDLVAIPNRLQ